MLKKIFKREKPRIYLGALVILPRIGMKKYFDSWCLTGAIEPDGYLKDKLSEIFCLPPASAMSDPLDTDLVIDVVISNFQFGNALFSDDFIPVFWRPRITLVSRLYYLESGKTKKVISVTEKMPWGKFFRRMLSFQGLVQWRSPFSNADLETLMYIASGKVMTKVKKSV